MLMDAVFGIENFRNEIIWKRTGSHNDARKFADINDCIFYYSRGKHSTWNRQYVSQEERYIKTHYNREDKAGRLYRLDNVIRSASMGPRPNLVYEYKGFTPKWGWRVVREKLEALDEAGRLAWSDSGTPYLVRYLDEMKGKTAPSLWDDIAPINSQAQERLGYQTQKPEALLERVLLASSNEGDTVLDPFCGCGTTIVVAQRLKRCWVGIDITHLAITLIRHRLLHSFGDAVKYKVIGEPVSLSDAQALALADRFQFQYWALGLVGARPAEQKKGADQGIDGRLYFHDEGAKGTTKQIILSVKSGGVKVGDVRDLRGVVEREKAAIGVLITLEQSTKPMRTEAAGAGFYNSPWGTKHPILQILTVEDLLNGKGIDYPHHTNLTFKRAPRKATGDNSTQGEIL